MPLNIFPVEYFHKKVFIFLEATCHEQEGLYNQMQEREHNCTRLFIMGVDIWELEL